MPRIPKALFLLALLLCAGCTRASSDARREHLLAGPHGWIDLTVHALAAAASSATRDKSCGIVLAVNGEPFVAESGDLVRADAAGNPLGYRVVVPAGALDTELRLDGCVPAQSVPLPLKLEANHLALLDFDGAKLALKSTAPWQPATLDGLHAEVAALNDRAAADDARFATLTRLLAAVLALNVALLAIVLARRR